MRIGQGYDVHRLTLKRELILGGVHVPFAQGLDGHSDADVLTHAIMDALLGAAGLGDIGQHFPDDDPAYLGADSLELLKSVMEKIAEAGYRVGNVDATLIAQRPRLSQYLPAMKMNLAGAMGVDPAQINLKATTEEGLGFTGEELGMAAQAVALLLSADSCDE